MTVRRALAAAVIAVGLGAAGIACPARELEVQITADGANTMIFACEGFREACAALGSCKHNPLLCELKDGACVLRNVCQVPDGPEWAPDETMGMQMLLLQAGANGLVMRKKSPCVPLNVRPCLPADVTGCPNAAADQTKCATDALTLAVQSALGGGLTFAGFKSLDDVILAAAFFHQPGDEASCDPSVLVGPDDCSAENLVAAAGLAAPAGSPTYDITCASCQGGPHTSLGRDNEPCPVTKDACFLQQIADLLAAKGP